MIPKINSVEEYNIINNEMHKAKMILYDYQMKKLFEKGIFWLLCKKELFGIETEETLKSLNEKEEQLRIIWKNKFSVYTIIKK